MSIFVTSAAWKYSKASGSSLLLLLGICDFADDDGRAYPSMPTLAAKARISERTAQYAANDLVAIKELVILANAGPRGCNLYQVQVQNLRGADSAGVQPTTEGGAAVCTRTVIEPSVKNYYSASAKQGISFDITTAEFTGISDLHLKRWQAAHPALDIKTELARCAAWLLCNPAGRPKANYARFLTNWFSRTKFYGQPKEASTPKTAHQRSVARAESWGAALFPNQGAPDERIVVDVEARSV